MCVDNGDQDRSGATGAGEQVAVRRPFRFSLALPLGQLLLCAALILIVCGPRSVLPARAQTSSAEVSVTIADHSSDGPEKRADEPSDHQMRIRGRVLSSVWLLNLPGGFLQMEAARYATNHQGWMARAADGFTTSFLSSSILALPFWWIAGRGADALLAMRRNIIAPRIRFSEAALAFVLLAGAGLLVIGALLAFVMDGTKPASLLLPISLLLWCFLGGIPLRARYKQLRMMRVPVNG